MVRTVHTNHFYEILAQISDPKIKFLTKTHFLKNDHVQNFWKLTFWPEKSPCGVVPQQNKGCKHIPEYSRPNSDQIISKNHYFYSKFIENRWFSIKIAKKIKLLRKLSYVCIMCMCIKHVRLMHHTYLGKNGQVWTWRDSSTWKANV